MSPYDILFAAGGAAAALVILHIVISRVDTGNAILAAALGAGFAAYTAVTIAQTGVMPVWQNHTTNLWGVQVWWDLLLSVGIALYFIAPRARAQGMNILLWALFVGTTASIGLLFMVARLFWLERTAAQTA